MYHYEFVTAAAGAGTYIIADSQGGSYYLPEQILSALPGQKLSVGDILHVTAEKPLEMTELAGTNSMICHGRIRVCQKGSVIRQNQTAAFLVSHTAYGTVLLTAPETGKDYVIFTSYVAEGYPTPGVNWSAVTEGNIVNFLLFDGMPVMPVPRKRISFRISRKNKKTPAERSFLNSASYGASSGASTISASSGSVS